MRFYTGMVLFLFIFSLPLLFSDGLREGFSPRFFIYFLDIQTFATYVFYIVTAIFVTNSKETFTIAKKALTSKSYKLTVADKEKAIELLNFLGKVVICVAIISSLKIFTLVFSNYVYIYPEPESIDRMIVSLGFRNLLFGFVAYMVIIAPAIYILKQKTTED